MGVHFVLPGIHVKEFTIGNEQLILSKDKREGKEMTLSRLLLLMMQVFLLVFRCHIDIILKQ